MTSKTMDSVENYFVVLPFSILACLKRSCSARFFSSRSCCALYANHCSSRARRRRCANLPSNPTRVGIGGGLFRTTTSRSLCLGRTATVIPANTTEMMGQTTNNTFTYAGTLPPPIARRRASRLSSGTRSHPQLGQHSKKLGISASQPKHFSSVGSSDIEHPKKCNFNSYRQTKRHLLVGDYFLAQTTENYGLS